MSGTGLAPSPSPAPSITASQSVYGQQFANPRPSPSPAPLTHQTSYGSSHSSAMPQMPIYQSQGTYNAYNTASTPVAQHNPMATYSHTQYGSQTAPRPVAQSSNSHSNAYNPPRNEVFILPDAGNNAINPEIRKQFHTDDYGRILFYTTPPLANSSIPAEKAALGHSLRYLADKARNKESDALKRKERDAELQSQSIETSKRAKLDQELAVKSTIETNTTLIKNFSNNIDVGTDKLYQDLHGEQWKEMRDRDIAKLVVEQEKASLAQKENLKFREELEMGKEFRIGGNNL